MSFRQSSNAVHVQVALWFDPGRSEDDNRQRILGAWRFVFFHELGHALVDLYDFAIVDEEDAVDDFSTLKLIEAGLTKDALSAAGAVVTVVDAYRTLVPVDAVERAKTIFGVASLPDAVFTA